MGIGFYDAATDKFDLVLSMQYDASQLDLSGIDDLTRWRQSFQAASELLFDATDGQHQLGNIYVCNNSTGAHIADAWLHDTGEAADANGYAVLGTAGIHMVFGETERFRPFVIIHEFGHHVYGLYDEYLGSALGGMGAQCIGDTDPDGSPATGCIMEAGWQRGIQIDPSTMALLPGNVSEFCSDANHTEDNLQEIKHHHSCWYIMKHGNPDPELFVPGYPDLVLPAGLPAAGPLAGADSIEWILLVEEQRFVLVLDRSGSMRGDKLTESKFGASFWVDSALVGDQLGIVSYADDASVDHPLEPIVLGMDRTPLHDAIEAIEADGSTAIGDGLRQGMDLILAPGTRAAAQVIALVTDGYHNTGEPPGAVLSELKQNGVRVYPVGIGPSVEVVLLLEIATETGGEFYRIDPALDPEDQRFEIRNSLIEIEGLAHEGGGIVYTIPGTTNPELREGEAYIEPGSRMATFALSWKNPEDRLYLELESPDGEYITLESLPDNVRPIYSERPYMGFHVADPVPGTWRLIVVPERVAEVAKYRLFAFSRNPRIDGGIISPRRHYEVGEVVPLQFQAYFGRPLTGLNVSGTVLMPGGESSSLRFDDGEGKPGHGIPGDGLYAALLEDTQQPGTYTVKVIAESDGVSASYPKRREAGDVEDSREQDAIPPFRREFTMTLAIGEQPILPEPEEPDGRYPEE